MPTATATATATSDPLLHSSKPSSKIWLNRIFLLIYVIPLSVLLLQHCRNIIHSPTTISALLFLADFVLGFLWLTQQCFHWNPIERNVFPEKLRELVAENEYPALDVVICTADPTKEPAVGVVNTALSVLAYEYPTEKLSVYVSDDGGSKLTLYAFMEGAEFAKHWIPYCKKNGIVDRAPEVHFGRDNEQAWFPETHEIKAMYESMKYRVKTAAESNDILLPMSQPMESKFRDAFSPWTPNFTPQHHPTVIQSLLDNGVDKDVENVVMPNLIYVTREKSHDKPHNFKAGALNVMLRVSGIMTGAPIVLIQDCDMYSNDPQTPLRALCYFLDPNADTKLAFVQFPQRYKNINKNDIYANEFKAETQILSLGMDGLLGAQFMGTGGFIKRNVFSGGSSLDAPRNNSILLRSKDKLVAAYEASRCNYEENTSWGSKIGFRYGTLTEDTYTSFRLHCEGWKSILCNPRRAAFLGGSPSNLNDSLTQIQRWYMGFLEILFNKYCPITYGIKSMNPLQALCYTHYTLRPFWTIPIFVYAFLPQISLINSFPIFTKDTKVGVFWYASLFLGAYGKEILDFVVFGGGSIQRWWSYQRMWLMWGVSSLPFALLEWSLKSFGLSSFGFKVTSKVDDEEQSSFYEQGLFEFGVESVMFFLISVASVINLLSFVKGIMYVFMKGRIEEFFVQIFIAGFVVVNSLPIYEAMIFRRDKGRMPLKITLASMVTAIMIYLTSSLVFES